MPRYRRRKTKKRKGRERLISSIHGTIDDWIDVAGHTHRQLLLLLLFHLYKDVRQDEERSRRRGRRLRKRRIILAAWRGEEEEREEKKRKKNNNSSSSFSFSNLLSSLPTLSLLFSHCFVLLRKFAIISVRKDAFSSSLLLLLLHWIELVWILQNRRRARDEWGTNT